MSQTHLPDHHPAHAVRPFLAADFVGDPFAQIRDTRAAHPLQGFDMGTTAVIAGSMIEGRVWVRANGKTWTLSVLDAATLALVMRCDDMRGAEAFAAAFARGAEVASRKVDELHTWSRQIRPTEDVE